MLGSVDFWNHRWLKKIKHCAPFLPINPAPKSTISRQLIGALMTVLMLGLTRKRGAVAEEQVFAATPSRALLTNWPGAAQILQLIIYNKERLIFQKWPIFHVFEMPLAWFNRSYLCGFRNVGVFLLEIGKACFRNASAFVPRRHSWDFFFLLNTFKATTDDFQRAFCFQPMSNGVVECCQSTLDRFLFRWISWISHLRISTCWTTEHRWILSKRACRTDLACQSTLDRLTP